MTEPRIYHEAIPYSRRTQSEKTADLPADEVRHLTSFDQELVHGMVELGVGFSHGRQLAHGPDGALYLVTESAVRGLLISGAASPAPRSECFTAPVAMSMWLTNSSKRTRGRSGMRTGNPSTNRSATAAARMGSGP